MLRVHQVRHRGARTHVGALAVLRPLHVRAGRGRRRTSGAGRRLRPVPEGQPQVQAVREDQQDGQLPGVLPGVRLRTRRQARVPRNHGHRKRRRCRRRRRLIHDDGKA